MKNKVFCLLAVVVFTLSTVNVNAYNHEVHALYRLDCNDIYDAYYEAAYFAGYSFGDALEIADAA